MDVVSDVLRAIRFTGLVTFHTELTIPWGLAVPPASMLAPMLGLETRTLIPFHAVAAGGCVSLVAEGSVEPLVEGDVVMYPQGDAHVLASDATVAPTPVGGLLPPLGGDDGLAIVRHGGGGAVTRLVCGFVHCDAAVFNPLAAGLPRVLCGRSHGETSLRGLLALALSEAATPRPGTTTLLTRITELMFVEVLRGFIAALPPEQTGWFAGLRDPHVGRALQLLHAEPARDWTVESLGRAVGLSRTALVDRFHALLGEPPMTYLTSWRIQLATQMLRDSHAAVAVIAEQVGYASEAAFGRAFRRVVGVPPAAWRRAARSRAASG